jgi:hypothetical protein
MALSDATKTFRTVLDRAVQTVWKHSNEQDWQRAYRKFRRYLKDPGDIPADDFALLAGLAIADTYVGKDKFPGWIPYVQEMAVKLARGL